MPVNESSPGARRLDPEALGEHVKTEIAKWTPVVKEASVQID